MCHEMTACAAAWASTHGVHHVHHPAEEAVATLVLRGLDIRALWSTKHDHGRCAARLCKVYLHVGGGCKERLVRRTRTADRLSDALPSTTGPRCGPAGTRCTTALTSFSLFLVSVANLTGASPGAAALEANFFAVHLWTFDTPFRTLRYNLLQWRHTFLIETRAGADAGAAAFACLDAVGSGGAVTAVAVDAVRLRLPVAFGARPRAASTAAADSPPPVGADGSIVRPTLHSWSAWRARTFAVRACGAWWRRRGGRRKRDAKTETQFADRTPAPLAARAQRNLSHPNLTLGPFLNTCGVLWQRACGGRLQAAASNRLG
jgi:hypothetical protein